MHTIGNGIGDLWLFHTHPRHRHGACTPVPRHGNQVVEAAALVAREPDGRERDLVTETRSGAKAASDRMSAWLRELLSVFDFFAPNGYHACSDPTGIPRVIGKVIGIIFLV